MFHAHDGMASEYSSQSDEQRSPALETAKKYYVSTKVAKHFIDNNLDAIVYHLLSQSPRNLSITRDNLGQSEYAMVEKKHTICTCIGSGRPKNKCKQTNNAVSDVASTRTYS